MARSELEIIVGLTDNTKRGLTSIIGALGKLGGLAAGAALGGVTALAGGLTALAVTSIPAASDLEESINKVNVVFDDAAGKVQIFAANAATALGQSKQQALEAAGTYGNLLTSIGLTTDKAADMSIEMVQLASDLASFNNASPEETLLALRSALTGEFEPMKRFGTALNQAAVEAKALELGLIANKNELTPAIKAQAAYALILEQTANAQGDFARTSEGLANAQRIVKAQVQDLRAAIGAFLLPVAQAFFGFLSTTALPVLKNFVDFLTAVTQGSEDAASILEELPAPLRPLAQFIGDLALKFKNLMEVIADAGPLSIEAREALGAIFGEGFVNTIFAIKDAVTGLYEIVRLLLTGDFRGGIFGLQEDDPLIGALFSIREAILGVIETATNFVNSIDWDAIGAAIGSAFEVIAGAVERIDWETLGEVISNVFETISGVVADIDWEGIGSTIGEVFGTISGAVSNIDWEGIGQTIGDVFNTISGAASNIDFGAIGELAGEIANTVTEAFGTISDWFNENWPQIQEFVTQVWEGIQEVIGSAIDVIVGEAWPQLVEAFETVKAVLEESGIDWQMLLDLLGAVAAFIGVTLVAAFVGAVGLITGVITGIANALAVMATHFEALKETGERIFEAITQVIQGFVDLVVAIVNGDWAGAWEAAKKIFSGAIDLITNLVTGIVQVFVGNFETILAFIGGFVEGIVKFFTNLYNRLIGGSIIPDMLNEISNFFTEKFDAIKEFVGEFIDGVLAFFQNLHDEGMKLFEAISTTIKETVEGALDGLRTKIETVMSAIQTAIEPAKSLWDDFVSAIESFWGWLSGKVFNFQINLPDLPDWAIPGSPLPIHTAWKDFFDMMQQATTNLGTIGGLASSIGPAVAAAAPMGGRAMPEGDTFYDVTQIFNDEGAAALGMAAVFTQNRQKRNAWMGG